METGRQKNELLAIGYMLDLIRHFAGANWTPSRVELPGPPLTAKAAVENVFACDLSRGELAAIIFPAGLLEVPNPRPPDRQEEDGCALPDANDIVACVEHLIGLGLLEGRPNIDWLCRRLQIPRRSLQRDLGSRGTSFEAILRRVLIARASELLRREVSATQTGFELGYTDSAHFSRAFRRWTGQTPRDWQAGI
ncbi:MAG: helix-turn-helix domain-containing protein [Methylocella sp.]